MSVEKGDEFFEIVNREFLPDEIDAIAADAMVNPYSTMPVEPGRELLLEAFHLLLEGLAVDKIGKDWEVLRNRFGELIIPEFSISPGDEILVEKPQVFIDANGPGFIMPGDKVFGDFASFLPDDAFFVDYYHEDEDAELRPAGDLGLYVALGGACIELVDGDRVFLGDAHISLSNGTPNLHAVIRY